jgi:AcrR family transcriptional regulator
MKSSANLSAKAVDKSRTQADRSRAMRERLIEATLASLIENGYARTTAVDICRRADVTRGALFHHFSSLSELLAVTLSDTYDRLFMTREGAADMETLEQWIDDVWIKIRQPEFKAVIEIWLASRNDPDNTVEVNEAIQTYKAIFSPEKSERLRKMLAEDREAYVFYRLAVETMFGLVLGRATTAGNQPLDHEADVLLMLKKLARQMQARK